MNDTFKSFDKNWRADRVLHSYYKTQIYREINHTLSLKYMFNTTTSFMCTQVLYTFSSNQKWC